MGANSQFDQNFSACGGKRPLRATNSTPSHSNQIQDTLTPSPEQYEEWSKPLRLVNAPNEMLDS